MFCTSDSQSIYIIPRNTHCHEMYYANVLLFHEILDFWLNRPIFITYICLDYNGLIYGHLVIHQILKCQFERKCGIYDKKSKGVLFSIEQTYLWLIFYVCEQLVLKGFESSWLCTYINIVGRL